MPDPVKVAFAINSRCSNAVHSYHNLMRALQNPVRVELVCFREGLTFVLAGEPSAGDTANLLAAGVTVVACQNSLDARHLDRSALLTGVRVVPGGAQHLDGRRRDGWHCLVV